MAVLEETTPAAQSTPARPSLFSPLANFNFRLLWAGQSISLFGDQFYLVALPWLTYQMTGSGIALGTVLMLAGIPRAVFMAFGGVLTDRLSPRWIMLGSNLLRFGLTAFLTGLILLGQQQLWMLYLISFLFGTVDAFFLPSQMSLIPSLVRPDELQAGNALFQMTSQLSQFVGPALAGLLISAIGGGSRPGQGLNPVGIGSAIGFDTLTFLAAAGALWLMRGSARSRSAAASSQSALAALKEGLRVVGASPVLLGIIVATCLMNLLFIGPIAVGIPALAATRFPQGAAALGAIISALGAGSLIGAALSGALRPRQVGFAALGTAVVAGLGLASLGLVSTCPWRRLLPWSRRLGWAIQMCS